jgi:hypothetical protein
MQHSSRSAFPFKKEFAIGFCIWLTYAVPAGVLFFKPKPQVANVCWIVVAGATAFLVLPLLIRLWMTWPQDHERTAAPSPE